MLKMYDAVSAIFDGFRAYSHEAWILACGAFLIFLICVCLCCYESIRHKIKKNQLDLEENKRIAVFKIPPMLKKERQSLGIIPEHYLDDDNKDSSRLHYSVEYNVEKNILFVTIIEAENLPMKVANEMPSPFVRGYLLPERGQRFETVVIKRSLNPLFDQTFSFAISPKELDLKSIGLYLYDSSGSPPPHPLGQVVVDLAHMDFRHQPYHDLCSKLYPTTFLQEDFDLGELCLSLRYSPRSNNLTAVVHEARNLKSMDIGGFSDPFVKLELMDGKNRLAKAKTAIKKQTLNPNFNENFVFNLSPENLEKVSLVVTVFDYDYVGYNDFIGRLIFGKQSGATESEHWQSMLLMPRRTVTRWHLLRDQRYSKLIS